MANPLNEGGLTVGALGGETSERGSTHDSEERQRPRAFHVDLRSGHVTVNLRRVYRRAAADAK